ncbi:hypothetical protein BDEG_22576 [Batrachochytrium dendrobatidis JEL423]|uniref:Uncharacterized protein n=1 Tax=Batrachochytrium dendrobatidis (strain JEL423) TaxID=403673 RepID=A0A177WEY1_BATDL|nr:hypothetical protein BDEG_22576 [Batrachochytrium dendrobatidis JEL423]
MPKLTVHTFGTAPVDIYYETYGSGLHHVLFVNGMSSIAHLWDLQAVSSGINSDTLVSPVPYTMSHIWIHMDTNATIKNQLSFTSPNCQPTIVLMDQRTNAKTSAHQTVYWT